MKKQSQKKHKRMRINPFAIICLILLITTFVGIFACIKLSQAKEAENQLLEKQLEQSLSENQGLQEQLGLVYTQEQMEEMLASASANASAAKETEIKTIIKDLMSTKEANTNELLRRLFPENIVYSASEGYVFAEINPNIPANNIDSNLFEIDDDGKITYTAPDGNKGLNGIDVSSHQGNINWKKVKEYGIDYAIIRVGFRGYGSGALVEDEQFKNNIEGALENDIDVGIYFFSQAITEDEAKEEAQFVIDALDEYNISYPVALDIETPGKDARGDKISREDRTKYATIFCEEIKAAGYTPMIYGNLFSLFDMLDMNELYQYETWFAFYNTYLYYPYKINTWQYTAGLTVPGIPTKVDANITFK